MNSKLSIRVYAVATELDDTVSWIVCQRGATTSTKGTRYHLVIIRINAMEWTAFNQQSIYNCDVSHSSNTKYDDVKPHQTCYPIGIWLTIYKIQLGIRHASTLRHQDLQIEHYTIIESTSSKSNVDVFISGSTNMHEDRISSIVDQRLSGIPPGDSFRDNN